jgi:predicted ATPase
MLDKLRVHGFRTLFNTEVRFSPFTVMIGKNGVGKTALLNVVEIIGKVARGGAQRAFGPPPWSLGWQRTKGIGRIHTTDFDLVVTTEPGKSYEYTLKLNERDGEAVVEEERLTRLSDHTAIASLEYRRPPKSGTILRPDEGQTRNSEIDAASSVFRSFESYELNPSAIERGNDPKITFVGRDGFGVAGFLAQLQDNDPQRFRKLEEYLKKFRPETEAIDVWQPSAEIFWGLRDRGQQYAFPAVHLSWGDRQLVGLLCILFGADPGSTIAIEEIDRGFHPTRFSQVIELLSEAVYDGLYAKERLQIIVTTHSPSFVNKLQDRIGDIRIATRAPNGGTIVRPLNDVVQEKLGPSGVEQPLGEVWEMGLLEETILESIQ